MILNIIVGENDSQRNPIRVFSTLEGPLSYEQLKEMWDAFKANIEETIGSCPQMWHKADRDSRNLTYKDWNENLKKLHCGLKEFYGIPQAREDFLVTRYFIELLIKHHGYKRVETFELFTED